MAGTDTDGQGPPRARGQADREGMDVKVKRLSIREFVEFGFLQELNRQFLHPLGMALEVVVDNESGEMSLGGIWDYRHDAEGMLFSDGIDEEKRARVEAFQRERFQSRQDALGFVYQDGAMTREELNRCLGKR